MTGNFQQGFTFALIFTDDRFLSGADRLILDQHPVCDFSEECEINTR